MVGRLPVGLVFLCLIVCAHVALFNTSLSGMQLDWCLYTCAGWNLSQSTSKVLSHLLRGLVCVGGELLSIFALPRAWQHQQYHGGQWWVAA